MLNKVLYYSIILSLFAWPALCSSQEAQSKALLQAIDSADLCTVERLLSQDSRLVHGCAKDFSTCYTRQLWKPLYPVLCAISYGNLAIVCVLLEHGGCVKEVSCRGHVNLALSMAASRGKLDIVKHLILSYGADVNSRSFQDLPLSEAIEAGHFRVVKFLCRHGARIETTAQRSHLKLAVDFLCSRRVGNLDKAWAMVRYLVQQGGALRGECDDEARNVISRYSTIDIKREHEAVGRALDQMNSATGLPTDLSQLILTFVNEHLRVPGGHIYEQEMPENRMRVIHRPQESGILELLLQAFCFRR